MSDIIDFNEAKKKKLEELEASHAIMEEVFEKSEIDNTLGLSEEQVANLIKELDLEPLFAALTLPEKEFAIINEVMLQELGRNLNDSNEKLNMVQTLNASGLKAEDLIESFNKTLEELETGLTGQISQQKIDFLKKFFGLITNAISETEGISKRIIAIPIEKCHTNAVTPAYAKVGDAGMDIYAVEDISLAPGETKIIPTGLKVAIPLGYELQVRPRSGLSLKTPLRVANAPGTIDSGYRDEIGVIITNTEPKIKDIEVKYNPPSRQPEIQSILFGQEYTIPTGMRFAQLILSEVPSCSFYEVENVGEIGFNREGGFGSSGVN